MMMREEVSRLASGLFAYCILRSTSGISRAGRVEGSRARAYGAKKKRSTAYRAYHIANCQLSQQQTSSPKQIPGVNNQPHTCGVHRVLKYVYVEYILYIIYVNIFKFYIILSTTTVIGPGRTTLAQGSLERSAG